MLVILPHRSGKTHRVVRATRAALEDGKSVHYAGADLTIAMHMSKPSTRMWLRMLETGNYDRRKMKRMWRLIEEGR